MDLIVARNISIDTRHKQGAVKTTYTFTAFLTPFPLNFCFAWCQQAGRGWGGYYTLAGLYGERIRCFTHARISIKRHYAECRVLFIGLLNAVMQNVVAPLT
jgi:hypothetical protein